MKTYVVIAGQKCYMTNAETPSEAVAYAIARAGIDALEYIVRDHDADEFLVTRKDATVKEDVTTI